MITIVEKTPEKLSGLTSLFVEFPFHPDILNVIKSSEKFSYNSKTHVWELPINCLAYLLDNLTYLDDIELILQKESQDKEHLVPILEHEYPPYSHQKDAIEWGLNRDSGLILDAPGVGKTLEIIYLAEELHKQKGLQHCLIICGINTLKSNWKKEIQKYSKLSCRVVGEKVNKKGKITYASMKDRAAELYQQTDAFFIIINIESIRADDIVQAIKTSKNKFDMIVVDEAHKCAGIGSNQSHNLLKLNSSKKFALSGSIITNNPLSAYIPLKWLGIEKSNLSNFKAQYCVYGGFGGHQIIGYKNLDILKEELENFSIRRTKEQLRDILPRTVINQYVELDTKHREFYDNIKAGIKEECDKINLSTDNVLALTTRLRQATACPQILTSENIESSKLERAMDLIEEICAENEKVVVMSNFKEPLNQLFKKLSESNYSTVLCHGDIPDSEVSKNIDLFQNDPTCKVFLGTCAKCGTGINLNAASYLIELDLPWTYALTDQVESRIDRINNTTQATIYRLICLDTIDELVQQIVESKKAMSEFLVDDKSDKKTIDILRSYIQDL